MRFKRFKIGLDFDDVLAEFNEVAVQKVNQKYNLVPPLSIEEIRTWGARGDRSDMVFEFYSDPDTYINQPIIPGAKEMITELMRMNIEVFIITAVHPEYMGYRMKRIMEAFPEVPKENIIMGTRKDLVQVDIMLDDAPHNIIDSKATYPVLLRRPWNQHMTGCLSVNNYGEFITLVKTIMNAAVSPLPESNEKIVVLVGPSASGKTELINRSVSEGICSKIKSTTIRKRRFPEEDDYYYITQSSFIEREKNGEFLETTRYASNCYGTTIKELQDKLSHGNAICAMDICGAVAVKKAFPDNALLVYVKRPKKELIKAILDRDISNADKTERIISINDEIKNEALCDQTVENTADIEYAYRQLVRIIG